MSCDFKDKIQEDILSVWNILSLVADSEKLLYICDTGML